jgi:hypothetical protein
MKIHSPLCFGFSSRFIMPAFTLMVTIALLGGCSQSYKPSGRPYYAYPPPAPSVPSTSAVQSGAPATQQSAPSASPGASSSFVEKTLEDSSAPTITKQAPSGSALEPSKSSKAPAKKEKHQRLTSVRLVDDARQMRAKGKVDDAIRMLERAIEIDAYNGEAFYEMALCWKAKGDVKKALGFADRAERVFSGNSEKLKKVYLLKAQLLESAGKKEEARKYRQKAR